MVLWVSVSACELVRKRDSVCAWVSEMLVGILVFLWIVGDRNYDSGNFMTSTVFAFQKK